MKNVLLRGEIGDNQSCGIVNIGMTYGFEQCGVNVGVDPKARYAGIPMFVTERIRRKLPYDTVIDHGLPHQMQGLGGISPEIRRIALCFWDSSLFSKEAADCINANADMMITHSDFTRKAALDAGVTKKVVVGAAGVFASDYQPKPIRNDDKYRFIFFGVAQGRKGVQEAIIAFESVLADRDDVEFIVKSNSWGRLCDYGVKAKNVKLIYEEYARPQMIDFLQRCDCFVCASKGDSFMFPGLEAMAAGLPLIITDFGGPTQYLNLNTGYPVKYTLQECHYLAGYQAEPDVQHLAETMKYVFEHKDEAEKKGYYGYLWAQYYWDWSTVAFRLIKDLDYGENKA